jgi:hypothetical protein
MLSGSERLTKRLIELAAATANNLVLVEIRDRRETRDAANFHQFALCVDPIRVKVLAGLLQNNPLLASSSDAMKSLTSSEPSWSSIWRTISPYLLPVLRAKPFIAGLEAATALFAIDSMMFWRMRSRVTKSWNARIGCTQDAIS